MTPWMHTKQRCSAAVFNSSGHLLGNKNDRIDARTLADLLRSGLLSPAYHGENGARTLRAPRGGASSSTLL